MPDHLERGKVPMSVLSDEQRLRVLAALVDGNSVRATSRMTNVNLRTILRLGILLGEGAQRFHDRLARNLSCSLIQVDEIWGYIGKKQARVKPTDGPDVGEAYSFVALDASSRFVITRYVGKRNQESTDAFITDLRTRMVVMPSMTSDGWSPYISAIGKHFGPGVDYAQVVKHYTKHGRREGGDDHRYEPPRDPFITKTSVFGAPNVDRASTSYIERNNGTMRHHIGRMRRLVYAFSRKVENHRAAVALCYAHYNFCHVVSSLRVTPAMAAGVTDHLWELPEFMAAVLEAPPVDKPGRQPLAPRKPAEPSRELPNGRGFLRLVPKSGAPQSPALPPGPPTPPALPAAVELPMGQLDLFGPRPPKPASPPAAPRKPVQLDLFGIEIEPDHE